MATRMAVARARGASILLLERAVPAGPSAAWPGSERRQRTILRYQTSSTEGGQRGDGRGPSTTLGDPVGVRTPPGTAPGRCAVIAAHARRRRAATTTQMIEPTLKTAPPPAAVLADDDLGAALVGVQALGQQRNAGGRLRGALVRLVAGRAAGAALVQDCLARRRRHRASPVPREDPVARRARRDPVRRARS